jgi:AmiR/NasT family two-component response regulator
VTSADLPDLVHRAAGLVAAQLGCSTADALSRMQDLGAQTESTVKEIARMVLDGDLRFDERPGGSNP